MVRFPSALRAPKRNQAADSPSPSRRLLRRLLDENVFLMRELEELRVLRRAAYQDSLTGLPNRRIFAQRLAEELSRSARDRTGVGALLVVDVNDLKLVNDIHGHAAGDDALRGVAELLRGALRTADVCCRTGGDEFMILLPDTDASGARQVMARLRAVVIRAGSRQDIPISISVGSASWPADGRKAEALIDKADRDMYAEKRRLRRRSRGQAPKSVSSGKLVLVK